ncbi:hypothetical protein ACE1CD_33050 [Aerosakkonema sp. BLCC-F183]|uniref:hypothetical protein n=1 Tax=Aerosakkonema sp. BLCC-F183 TaxID=3342834 RepID=UPI0035B6ECC1
MQVDEVLEFVDRSVYAKTGTHLNDLQRGIIEGILKRQKYAEIADNNGCSAGYAKDVGYKLLQMLSDVFDESVNKRNLKSVLERQGNIKIIFNKNKTIDNNMIGYINICSEKPNFIPDKIQSESANFQQESKHQANMETIDKLRQFGLSDEQIAAALNLPLEVIKQI